MFNYLAAWACASRPLKIGLALSVIGVSFCAHAKKKYDCVNAGRRWDKIEEKCYPGRTWTTVPQKMRPLFDRPLTPVEFDSIRTKFRIVVSDPLKCHQIKPQAIVLFGSAGSGKSSLQEKLMASDSKILNHFDPSKFTTYDGDDVREANLDFRKYSTQLIIGYTDVVDLMNKYIHETKDYYLNEIIENQCNVILSTVVAKINENEIQYISDLVNGGYEMYYFFVYSDYEKTVYRAKNRAQWTGRWFNEAVEKKEKWKSQADFAFQIFDVNPLTIQFYNNTSSSDAWFMNLSELKAVVN